MGEGECESLPGERPKKSRHRKKHLYNSILQQMEFYFSDSNLVKDRFLSQLLSENPYVDIEVFFKFNKIRKLNCTAEDIKKAMRKSDLIGITEDGLKLFRKHPCKAKENVDFCTIYVENIKADANHESLSQIFSNFGKVVYVSIPKYKHNKANKGFAFIEYETEEQANEAIAFFESIDCKMPLDKNPQELKSIVTFQKEQEGAEIDKTTKQNECDGSNVKNRKLSGDELEVDNKKSKTGNKELTSGNKEKQTEDADQVNTQADSEGANTDKRKRPDSGESDGQIPTKKRKLMSNETEDIKKKKKSKKDKRKAYIKELGMQILSKKEWKKLRNRYLDLQRKNMKSFKQYLHKQKFSPKTGEEIEEPQELEKPIQEETKLVYTDGVIVKLKLSEACTDVKKLKNEIKSISPEVKYVDIPLPAGSEEVYIRFGTKEAAFEFCNREFDGEKIVIDGDEEKCYWDKIQTDRTVKFQKSAKKQRGRDKLLKRAEKESAKHIKFEENE